MNDVLIALVKNGWMVTVCPEDQTQDQLPSAWLKFEKNNYCFLINRTNDIADVLHFLEIEASTRNSPQRTEK